MRLSIIDLDYISCIAEIFVDSLFLINKANLFRTAQNMDFLYMMAISIHVDSFTFFSPPPIING